MIRIQNDLNKYFNLKVDTGRRKVDGSYYRGLIGLRLCRENEVSNLQISETKIEFEQILNVDPFHQFPIFDYKKLRIPKDQQKRGDKDEIN
jgi:hypothetical protein